MDDLGWRDLTSFGSSFYETPHLDRLAAEGMRFTDAYAASPVCSPTRASILTGKYPANIGLTDYIDWGGEHHPTRGRLIDAPYIHHLPLEERSTAAILGENGYQTWHIGKWHLGDEPFHPEKHGFEVNIAGSKYGHPPNGFFAPWQMENLPDQPAGTYLPDYLTDRALELIAQRDKDRPFFLNMWYYLVHTPIEAPPHLVEKYRKKAADLGLDRQPALVEGEYFPSDFQRHRRVIRRLIQSDPTYAAMIESMDHNIGRLLQGLVDSGLDANTLVIFTSDNGGLSTAEGSPTSNRPLSEGKGWMAEGGVRVPLIMRWPGEIEPGTVCYTPVSSPDFQPTLLDITGVEGSLPLDGISLRPILQGEALQARPLFWHYPHYGNQGGTPGSSVRQGDYKLIEYFEDGRLELYNLKEDSAEAHNLVA